MSNNLEQFRQGLKKAHADLEMEPPFRAVSGHTVTMADVKNFLSILHRFYQAADNHIIHSPFAIDGLYQRRADLLAEDIKNIGGEPVFTYLFTRTGLTASVLPGWDNLSSRCTP